MTNPEFLHDQPVTPEQAQALFAEVGKVTAMQGKNYGDTSAYGADVAELPGEVAIHLPDVEEGNKFKDSVYVTQKLDRTTGQPLRSGVVGMVSFTRAEMPDEDLTYAAHANYHITTKDEGASYAVERHVTNTEHGLHKVREMRQKLGRAATDPEGAASDMLQELTDLREKLEQSRPVEESMGLFTVTQSEAQQIIAFMKSLDGQQ